jgi:hypothetical protein
MSQRMSVPLIGRHCQAPVLRLLLQFVSGVGWATVPGRSEKLRNCLPTSP